MRRAATPAPGNFAERMGDQRAREHGAGGGVAGDLGGADQGRGQRRPAQQRQRAEQAGAHAVECRDLAHQAHAAPGDQHHVERRGRHGGDAGHHLDRRGPRPRPSAAARRVSPGPARSRASMASGSLTARSAGSRAGSAVSAQLRAASAIRVASPEARSARRWSTRRSANKRPQFAPQPGAQQPEPGHARPPGSASRARPRGRTGRRRNCRRRAAAKPAASTRRPGQREVRRCPSGAPGRARSAPDPARAGARPALPARRMARASQHVFQQERQQRVQPDIRHPAAAAIGQAAAARRSGRCKEFVLPEFRAGRLVGDLAGVGARRLLVADPAAADRGERVAADFDDDVLGAADRADGEIGGAARRRRAAPRRSGAGRPGCRAGVRRRGRPCSRRRRRATPRAAAAAGGRAPARSRASCAPSARRPPLRPGRRCASRKAASPAASAESRSTSTTSRSRLPKSGAERSRLHGFHIGGVAAGPCRSCRPPCPRCGKNSIQAGSGPGAGIRKRPGCSRTSPAASRSCAAGRGTAGGRSPPKPRRPGRLAAGRWRRPGTRRLPAWSFQPAEHRFRPLVERDPQQRQIEQPLAGIIEELQPDPLRRQIAEQAGPRHDQVERQQRRRVGPRRPGRRVGGEGGEMPGDIEARQLGRAGRGDGRSRRGARQPLGDAPARPAGPRPAPAGSLPPR